MSKSMLKRIEKLERIAPCVSTGKGHWLISEQWEDREAKEAALRASPEWQDGDHITHWVVVDPPQRSAA